MDSRSSLTEQKERKYIKKRFATVPTRGRLSIVRTRFMEKRIKKMVISRANETETLFEWRHIKNCNVLNNFTDLTDFRSNRTMNQSKRHRLHEPVMI